ncbi:MAG TPA: 50S ribosomal protein L33 [Oculatellaceae cyanobacterium]
MAKKGEGNVHIVLESSESSHQYHTTKNKKKHQGRMEIKKYDPIVRRHVMYKESKSSK